MSAVRGFTPSPGLAPLTPKEDHRSPPASHPAACLHRNFSRGLASQSARVRGRALPRLDFACAAVSRKVLPSNFHVFVLLRRRRSSSSDGAWLLSPPHPPPPRAPGVCLPEPDARGAARGVREDHIPAHTQTSRTGAAGMQARAWTGALAAWRRCAGLLLLLHLVAHAGASSTTSSSSFSSSKPCEKGCHAGRCVNGSCACDHGWVGEQCQHCQGRFK